MPTINCCLLQLTSVNRTSFIFISLALTTIWLDFYWLIHFIRAFTNATLCDSITKLHKINWKWHWHCFDTFHSSWIFSTITQFSFATGLFIVHIICIFHFDSSTNYRWHDGDISFSSAKHKYLWRMVQTFLFACPVKSFTK